jgi:hypothetical protein
VDELVLVPLNPYEVCALARYLDHCTKDTPVEVPDGPLDRAIRTVQDAAENVNQHDRSERRA